MRTIILAAAVALSGAAHAGYGNNVALKDASSANKAFKALADRGTQRQTGYVGAGLNLACTSAKSCALTLSPTKSDWKLPAGFPKHAGKETNIKLTKSDSIALVHAMGDKWKWEPSDAAIAYVAGAVTTGATLVCVQRDTVKASKTKQAECTLTITPLAKRS